MKKIYQILVILLGTAFIPFGCTIKNYDNCECECDDASVTADNKGGENGYQPDPDSGTVPSGTGLWEGEVCQESSECRNGLTCIATDPQGLFPSICARRCTDDSDCDVTVGEACYDYTGLAIDRHCSKRTEEEYGNCHILDTTHCAEPMMCVIYSTDFRGMCVLGCEISTNGEGVCRSDQDCLEGMLADENLGICGSWAERGESCEISFCRIEDTCSPDLENPNADWTCREICEQEGDDCEQGTCVDFSSGQGIALACYE